MKPHTPANALRIALDQARNQWAALSERDRLALKGVGAVLGLLLIWLVLISPAQRTLKNGPAQLDALELRLQQMQSLAAEAAALRSAPGVPAAAAQAALNGATERLGSTARLQVTGERAVVTLNGVAPEALQAWLGEVRAAARARPVEAQLTRGPKGYSGTLVLLLSGGNS